MNDLVVLAVLIVVAAISLALGYALARSRSAAQLAAASVRAAQLEGQLLTSTNQVASLEQRRAAEAQLEQQLTPLSRALSELSMNIRRADQERAAADESIKSQLKHQQEVTVAASQAVQREAGKLARALSRTNTRGHWGESELRRLVEAAGMLERVHFAAQATHMDEDEAKRPDMIIHLAGARDIVVDAKAPLNALMGAVDDDSDNYSDAALKEHARALKSHIDALAKRDYSKSLANSPELVVMYLPAESLLSLALAADAGLLDYAFSKGIALATPTTMMALLRTVAHGWRQEAVAENARRIHSLGTELHQRLQTMSKHFQAMGLSLDKAVKSYNQTVASYESRVLVSARRLSELDPVIEVIEAPPAVETATKSVTVIDIADDPVLRTAAIEQAS